MHFGYTHTHAHAHATHTSMYDTFSDEFGTVDFQRSQHGSGMSQRSQAKRFISELSRISEHTTNSTFTVQQMRDTAKVNVDFLMTPQLPVASFGNMLIVSSDVPPAVLVEIIGLMASQC